MARNVEIKARLHNRQHVEMIVQSVADSGPTVLHQIDHFFVVRQGRLKLRILGEDQAELIFYNRPDQAGPKLSSYEQAKIEDPQQMARILRSGLGIQGTVEKKRTLYLIGQTRVHLDEVVGLGDFLELEVVLENQQSVEFAEEIAKEILKKLEITTDALVEGAYLDLLSQ